MEFNLNHCNIVYQKAVCQGVTFAFKFLCDKLGLHCIIEGIFNQEGHVWNIIRINHKNYHIDALWNLFPKEHESTYFYFCKPDSLFSRDYD